MQPLTLIKALKDPRIVLIKLLQVIGPIIPDEPYLKVLFRLKMGRKLDLKNPKTYNEKLQWLKLYNRKQEYSMMVDKYEVKNYVANIIGPQYILPTYGIWNRPESIDLNKLPNEFVLKTTHGGGSRGLVICEDKSRMDVSRMKRILDNGIRQNIYLSLREWPYKNVKPRIIAEYLLKDGSHNELDDYKVLCFHGKALLIEHHIGRFSKHHKQNFYTPNWELTTISQSGYSEKRDDPAPKPQNLAEMISLSEQLSKNIPHIRVDWYQVKDRIYFSELTFFDGSGFAKFDNYNDDLLLGSYIDLSKV